MDHPNIEIVGVNDLCPADYLAYICLLYTSRCV